MTTLSEHCRKQRHKLIPVCLRSNTYPTVTSAQSCNNVESFVLIYNSQAQHETNDVILYIHSVHKHRGNTFQRQNYKMRLKQRSLN